jgi:glucosamine 6-phosphate synthetase-like amidotransferase/phosphosugar isomerase protein
MLPLLAHSRSTQTIRILRSIGHFVFLLHTIKSIEITRHQLVTKIMCGIVGYIGTQAATDILISGLERLEYRGYDSAGVATVTEGKIHCVKAKGKLYNLREKLERDINQAQIGIGHTRWATHGKPEEHNAHPHLDASCGIAVVQNGIIETIAS